MRDLLHDTAAFFAMTACIVGAALMLSGLATIEWLP